MCPSICKPNTVTYIGGGLVPGLVRLFLGPWIQFSLDKGASRVIINCELMQVDPFSRTLGAEVIVRFSVRDILGGLSHAKTLEIKAFGLIFLRFVVFGRPNINILKELDSFSLVLTHSLMDTASLLKEDGQINYSFKERLLSGSKCLKAYVKGLALIHMGITDAFLGHQVYDARVLAITLASRNVKLRGTANGLLFNIDRHCVRSPYNFDAEQLHRVFASVDGDAIESYLEKKFQGLGNYDDSNLAWNKSSGSTKKNLRARSLVMLHVFRDSSFLEIDRSRIFWDYTDWVTSMLAYGHRFNDVIFKFHPSACRWGEDSNKWLKSLESLTENGLRVASPNDSNSDLFRNVDRLFTFHGTSALEALAHGIPVVVVSADVFRGMPEIYDGRAVRIISDTGEIPELLHETNKKLGLEVSEEVRAFAQKLIWAREVLFNFGSLVNYPMVYRGDDEAALNAMDQVIANSENLEFTQDLAVDFFHSDKRHASFGHLSSSSVD